MLISQYDHRVRKPETVSSESDKRIYSNLIMQGYHWLIRHQLSKCIWKIRSFIVVAENWNKCLEITKFDKV